MHHKEIYGVYLDWNRFVGSSRVKLVVSWAITCGLTLSPETISLIYWGQCASKIVGVSGRYCQFTWVVNLVNVNISEYSL